MLELITKVRALYAAFQSGDFWAVLKIVGELMIVAAALKNQPVMGTGGEKEELAAAIAEAEECCTVAPVMKAGAEGIDPERWSRIMDLIKTALEVLKWFI